MCVAPGNGDAATASELRPRCRLRSGIFFTYGQIGCGMVTSTSPATPRLENLDAYPPPLHSSVDEVEGHSADGTENSGRRPKKHWSKPTIQRVLDAALDTGTGHTPNMVDENATYSMS